MLVELEKQLENYDLSKSLSSPGSNDFARRLLDSMEFYCMIVTRQSAEGRRTIRVHNASH